jgi:hypothetical protein
MFLHQAQLRQNYRNGVGSGYAMRTYKDLDKGYYSSPPLQTTLYNNIPFYKKQN